MAVKVIEGIIIQYAQSRISVRDCTRLVTGDYWVFFYACLAAGFQHNMLATVMVGGLFDFSERYLKGWAI